MSLNEALALGMMVALCALMMFGFPVAFTLGGTAFATLAIGMVADPSLASFLTALPQRIYGTMTNDTLVAIPLFVFMGVLLERSAIAERLLTTMGLLLRRVPGGLAVGVVAVGALLAASTGVVGATVVTMGLLSLPVMLKAGYAPSLATGTIAASGTLGQIIPPSIVLVVLGDELGNAYQRAQLDLGNFAPDSISVADLFAGALLPGIALAVLYALYAVAIGILRPSAAPPVPEGPRVSLREIAEALAAPLLLIAAVLGSILGGIATSTEAAAIGALGALLLAGRRAGGANPWPIDLAGAAGVLLIVLVSAFDLRLGRSVASNGDQLATVVAAVLVVLLAFGTLVALLRAWTNGMLQPAAESTTWLTAMIFAVIIGSSMFSLVFIAMGGADVVDRVLQALPGGPTAAVALVMAVVFILGFPLDFIEIVYIVVPVAGPILLKMDGIDPVWLGVMFAMNLQTSFLTPPLGPTLFYLQGVAPPGIGSREIYRGVWPFVAIQLVGLGLLWVFPAIATWLPSVLMPR